MGHLLQARTFEAAADVLLEGLVEHAATRLGQPDARIVRGVVHLRPGGDYLGLRVWVPTGDDSGAVPSLPSASSWERVVRDRRAVAVDLRLNLVEGDTPEPSFDDDASLPQASIHRMLDRGATHLLALPMRGAAGALHGMVSLEVECPAATGVPGLWSACAANLQYLVDLATGVLVVLPPREHTALRDDPLLPVVGSATAGLIAMLEVFAQQDETLLISGATGTGKSRLARWCHARSEHKDGPFEHVDLLTVPEDMQMAELFGWKRGAFTGAVKDQQGRVASAGRGTLFLDEIDKLSLKAQAGLLQLLETREYHVLGDSGRARTCAARFVIGTNASLREAVAEGRFREDLFYRINVLPVTLPPLDARSDEIPAWAAFMARRRHGEGRRGGRAVLGTDAQVLLSRRSWPGNLRQLDNVVRRAYALALVDATADRVNVQGHHVERALGFEAPATTGSSDLIDALRRAATALIDAAEARPSARDLQLTEAWRGFVLAEALARQGDLRDVFRWFGRHKVVESRNHSRELRRALEAIVPLADAVGVAVPPDVTELLGR